MVEELTGITQQKLKDNSLNSLFSKVHPDDLPQLFAFTKYWVSILSETNIENRRNLHPTICIRIRNGEDLYRWVMIKYVDNYYNNNGLGIYGFTLVTDISNIKKEGPAVMCILNTSDNTCQYIYCNDESDLEINHFTLQHFTHRELEILKLLAMGKSSKQIASDLDIAIKTVDNHRQKMLEKVNAKSSAELVSFGINGGFI